VNIPGIDAISTIFFELLASGRLCTTRCNACETLAYPPRTWCHACTSEDLDWVDLSGRGTLVAFSTQETATRFRAPDVIGLVDLDEGVRMLSRIAGTYEELRIGQTVTVAFFEAEPGLTLHQFVPAYPARG
jgi:uncharacterized OB-fold protein